MFENIIGHDRNKVKFSKITSESLRHAYIFTGGEGIGKMTFALEVAKKFSGIDRNIKIIKPEKNNIPVDVIRSLQEEFINGMPLGGMKFKKFILIDDAHCLNETSSNALLKILEEPPSYCVFILVVEDINKLLDTIKSRCVIEKFNYVDKSIIDSKIMDKLSVEDEMFLTFLNVTIGGKIGELIRLCEDEDVFTEYSLLYNTAIMVETLSNFKGVKPVSEYFSLDSVDKCIKELVIIRSYYAFQFFMGSPKGAILNEIIDAMTVAIDNLRSGGSTHLVVELMLLNIVKINKRGR